MASRGPWSALEPGQWSEPKGPHWGRPGAGSKDRVQDHETTRPGAAAAPTLGAGPASSGPHAATRVCGRGRTGRETVRAGGGSPRPLPGLEMLPDAPRRQAPEGTTAARPGLRAPGAPEGQRPGRWARRGGLPPTLHARDRRPCRGTKDGRSLGLCVNTSEHRAGSGFARGTEGQPGRGGSSAPHSGKAGPAPPRSFSPAGRRQGNRPHAPPPRHGGGLPSGTGSGTASAAQLGLPSSPPTVFTLVRRPQPQGQPGHSPARTTPRLNTPHPPLCESFRASASPKPGKQ